MKQLTVKIIENKRIAPDFYKLRVASIYLAKNTKPGQFLEVRCSDSDEPLLRRPLGAHRILKSGIEMLYGVVGKGTELLSRKKTGEYLDVIGPLGNGFIVNRPAFAKASASAEASADRSAGRHLSFANRTAMLVAGGIGVAPLVALAESIAYRKKQKIYVLIGAKTKSHILCESDFKKIGCEIKVSTEDGSKGKKCLVTELLKDVLSAKRYPLNAMIYACGPSAMLKAVAKIAENQRIPCQVSMEERMACGVGVCLGCPVKIKANDEYKMVCKDGPVFNAKEIAW